MATLNFPDEPTTGDIYTDSNSGFSYEWNGTVWISTDPQRAANIREIDDISSGFDGSETDFTLQVAGVNVEPASAQQLIISVGGVMQNAGDDFTVSGSTLTFTTAPTSGLTFFGTSLGQSLSLNTVADASVGSSSLKTEDFTIGGSGNTVTIPGNLTVQGTETIINTERLDIQDKTVGIASTNAPSSTSQDDAGIVIYGQTQITALYDVDKAALGISTNVNVAGFVTATGLRSLGVTTCGAGLSLADSVKAKFGASGDLEIYHDGSSSYIKNNTGNFEILANEFRVKAASGGESLMQSSDESDVQLFYDGVKRIETASNDEGGGVIVTGKIVGTAATIGSGVTINNTGIDAGNAGIVTAGTISAPSTLGFEAGGATNLTFDGLNINQTMSSDGRGLIQTASGNYYILNTINANVTDANYLLGMIQAKWNGTHVADISFSSGADNSNKDDGTIQFRTSASAGGIQDRLKINQFGGFQFSNGLFDETCNIVANKLSAVPNISLNDGMVHYFTTQETGTATPNIRIDASNTLQDTMDTGDVCTVTLITTAAAAGYYANLTIDGNAVTEEWVGGAAPSAGSADGLDIYTYTIICIGTGTGDSGFKVIANLTNATN